MIRRRVEMSRVALGWQSPWSVNESAVKKVEAFKRTLE
jgi:hypothetical protein